MGNFKFFTDHSALKSLGNKPVLEGRICRWLLLFQEFSFEVVVKPGKLNVGPDHLSRLESEESGGAVDDQLPDAYLFKVSAIPDYLSDIALFLTTGAFPADYSATQKRHLVVRAADYQLIAGQLYKSGLDNILRRCVLDHERPEILWECHSGVAGGHVGGKATAQKVLQAGLWWPTSFKMLKNMLGPVMSAKGLVDHPAVMSCPCIQFEHDKLFQNGLFLFPINPPARHSHARYIITAIDYLTRWAEAEPVQDCSTATAARFLFENIITRFGCPRSLTSDKGAHFISQTIATLTKEF